MEEGQDSRLYNGRIGLKIHIKNENDMMAVKTHYEFIYDTKLVMRYLDIASYGEQTCSKFPKESPLLNNLV